MPLSIAEHKNSKKVKPVCPIFGECGGCQYQDMPYEEQLRLKETELKELFLDKIKINKSVFLPIVSSPKQLHYRSRIDLQLIKTKQKEIFIGFTPNSRYKVIPAESCAIAMESISEYIPELKKKATEKLPEKYRNANIVVKTGDDGRIQWGGIGRKSLQREKEDYLSTNIHGRKIFYSLDTFFQANLSILPSLMDQITELGILTKESTFFDLYGGVGLFGVYFYDLVKEVVLIEENIYAVKVAQHNAAVHNFDHFQIIEGRVEDHLDTLISSPNQNSIAMIDPPRQGLSPSLSEALSKAKTINHLLYLSCNKDALVRDLAIFVEDGWEVVKIIPFDFFPQTKHLETLVWLKPGS